MVRGTFKRCAGQVPVDDPLVGRGTSAPDGDIALEEDADETQEQSEKRKEAEESFKVGAFVYSLIGPKAFAWQNPRIYTYLRVQN